MDLDNIKRGLRAEIKKRETEQYFTFQTNIRQMCKDVLAKLEEQESEIAELKDKLRHYPIMVSIIESAERDILRDSHEIRHHKYKRCLGLARWCASRSDSWCLDPADEQLHKSDFYDKWKLRWL